MSEIQNEDEEAVLAKQLAEMQERLAAIQQAKKIKQERLQAEIEAYDEDEKRYGLLKIEVVALEGSFVIINAPFRIDLLQILRTTEGRTYRSGPTNCIPVMEWENFVVRVKALPNTKVVCDIDLECRIVAKINEPTYEVEVGKYEFEIKSRAQRNILYQVPGNQYHSQGQKWTVPFSEGYKLFEVLEQEKVKWSDEAKERVTRQVENRAKLDRIATMERGEVFRDFEMNGMKLRPFQEIGCDFADATDIRCLLAYEMGLGKTPMSIAMAVKHNLRTLIVVPASLKNNWARQILKFTNQRPKVLRGAEPTRLDIADLITDPQQFTIINYDILATKQDYVDETKNQEGYTVTEEKTAFPWAEVLNIVKFDLIIYDEVHYAKNYDSNRSKASRMLRSKHVLPMTGTPVLNRPGELWPILNIINPKEFPAFDTFVRQYTKDGKTVLNVEQLKNTLKTLMIRRLKKDVKKDLDPINRIHEMRPLSERGQKLYDKVLAGVYHSIDAAGREWEQKVTNILVQIQRLKQVCALDMAGHSADLAVQLYDQTDVSEKRKVIIFSQFKMAAYKITQLLGDEAIGFVTRTKDDFKTADMADRDAIIQRFQTEPDIHFLVVTEKTTKEGHDITEAGHVVFNDLFWTPAAHEQAEGRAYGRESDSHNINSYYMVTDMDGHSINEWIMTLLADKMRMIEATVEGVEGARDASVAMDLIRKLKAFRG